MAVGSIRAQELKSQGRGRFALKRLSPQLTAVVGGDDAHGGIFFRLLLQVFILNLKP